MDAITILAPAKVNLALDVTGRMPNGYHALDMVMQALALSERITLQKAEEITLTLPGSSLAGDADNIAWKAAAAFLRYTKLSAGVALTVEKHTPVQAGMGGGSADAAGVLVGMNELYADRMAQKLSMSELLALGAALGADVPFALMGGTCRVQGIGDFLCPLPPMPACGIVIVMPEYGVSTPAAFRAFDEGTRPFHPDVAGLDAALRAGDFAAICAAAGNALEAVGGAPETPEIKRRLRETGARAALMTGSGAAVFGLYDTRKAAEAAAKTLHAAYARVYVTEPVRTGPVVAEKTE